MYCPNCGKTNSAEQKFCRSCGLSLEKTVQSLVEQLPALESDKLLQERQRKLDRLINIVAGSAISIVVGAVLWGIVYEIIFFKGQVIPGLIFLALIIGVILFGLLSIYRESLRKKAGTGRLVEPPQQLEKNTGKLLSESHFEPLPSVTERTTELLVEDKGNKRSTKSN
jgi:zinc ribbon protein